MSEPASERARRLAASFQSALSAGIHPSGCFCGGMFRPAIEAASLEQDVLDYLIPRYSAQGPAALVNLLRARQQEPGTRRFTDWLRRLPEAALAEPDRARLFDDLDGLFASFLAAAQPAGNSRFACT